MAHGVGAGKLYLGLDSSTQSLSAVIIEVRGTDARVVLDTALGFDEAFPHYGTQHGVLPRADSAVAMSSPVMWAEALDLMMGRLAASGVDLQRLVAISGSAQQHGSVYLRAEAARRLTAFDPAQPLAPQIMEMLSRPVAPIWMDSSTAVECAEISQAVGGASLLAARTGSRAFERFTGPQIRKFAKLDPDAYRQTARIHFVSSFLASLLAGRDAPVDPGDASGANLMDLSTATWWDTAVQATAPDLMQRLPAIASADSVVGPLAPYWRARHGLPAAKVVTWSGDNPCSLIGAGLVLEGRVAISLGTSDTIFGLLKAPRVDPGGTGHVFGAPTGDYMGLTCFSNGALARERVRDAYGLSWEDFSRALQSTPAGNGGRILIPWFEPEITPPVRHAAVHRYGLAEDDVAGNVRAVVEAQQMALALHSRWMSVDIGTIHATGGASVNDQILHVMANVFGADVYRSAVTNAAALGAALRAWHADASAEGRPLSWQAVTAGLTEPASETRIAPDPRQHAVYRTLLPVYQACEARALGRSDA